MWLLLAGGALVAVFGTSISTGLYYVGRMLYDKKQDKKLYLEYNEEFSRIVSEDEWRDAQIIYIDKDGNPKYLGEEEILAALQNYD